MSRKLLRTVIAVKNVNLVVFEVFNILVGEQRSVGCHTIPHIPVCVFLGYIVKHSVYSVHPEHRLTTEEVEPALHVIIRVRHNVINNLVAVLRRDVTEPEVSFVLRKAIGTPQVTLARNRQNHILHRI